MNDGHSFQSMTAVWEINESSISRGSIVVDLDKDGIQDLIVGNIDAPAEIWWGRCMNGDWISLQIEQNSMNRYGVGSKVTSITESGQHTQWIVAGDSFASGGPPTVHFGLGSISEEMTNIIIELPTGQRFEHQLEKNMHHIVHLDE
jgi:hypothetical protein